MSKWTHKIDPDSTEYKQIQTTIEESKKEAARQYAYKRKAIFRIIDLVSPAKSIGISRLDRLSIDKLTKIGMAAKVLYEELDAAGLIERVTRSYNNRDF